MDCLSHESSERMGGIGSHGSYAGSGLSSGLMVHLQNEVCSKALCSYGGTSIHGYGCWLVPSGMALHDEGIISKLRVETKHCTPGQLLAAPRRARPIAYRLTSQIPSLRKRCRTGLTLTG